MSEKRKELLRSLKFFMFSVSAGVIQVVSFTVMEEVLHLEHWLSYLGALLLSVLWNFTLNRKYTFKATGNVSRAMALVALFYVVFTPLSTWWTAVLTGENFMINEYIVLAGTMASNFIGEYLYQRFVVYGKTVDTAN